MRLSAQTRAVALALTLAALAWWVSPNEPSALGKGLALFARTVPFLNAYMAAQHAGLGLDDFQRVTRMLVDAEIVTIKHNLITITDRGRVLAEEIEEALQQGKA